MVLPRLKPGAATQVETERLMLRAPRIEDFEDFAAMWTDPAVTGPIGMAPLTREGAWAKLLREAGHCALLGYGFWVAAERRTGAFVGQIGLACLKHEAEAALGPELDGRPEVGWAVTPRQQRRGYAAEAARAALAWSAQAFGDARVYCGIHPDNAPSLALAATLGFAEFARLSYNGHPTILLER